jgi:uncharacterized phage protein (TIGR01671 family)
MSRVIKFRGKRTDNGEWVYGDYCSQDAEYNALIGVWNHFTRICDWVTVWDDSVGQFTGLYDRSNKEIYESDILSCSDGRVAKVFYYEVGWAIESKPYSKMEKSFAKMDKEPGEITTTVMTADRYGRLKNTKVIGNIYENPDLIQSN